MQAGHTPYTFGAGAAGTPPGRPGQPDPFDPFLRGLAFVRPGLLERALRGRREDGQAPPGEAPPAPPPARRSITARGLRGVKGPKFPRRPLLPTTPTRQELTVARPREGRELAAARLLEAFRAEHPGVKAHLWATFGLLLEVALGVAGARGYCPGAHSVTFFASVEVLAWAAGRHRSRVSEHLRELEALGLVARRGHVTASRRQGRVLDGTVFTVWLAPRRRPRARVRGEDLAHRFRDLDADAEAGHTAHRLVRAAAEPAARRRALLAWALGERGGLERAQDPAAPEGVWAVYDLLACPPAGRARMVDAVARLLARELDDRASANLYRALLWGVLRAQRRGEELAPALVAALERARTDRREGFARRAGALLVARLRRAGLWERLVGGGG